MSISVANEGPVPVDIVTTASSQLGVDTTTFAFSDQWHLAPLIYAQETTVGATKARRFPAVTMAAQPLVTARAAFAARSALHRHVNSLQARTQMPARVCAHWSIAHTAIRARRLMTCVGVYVYVYVYAD